MKILITGGCGFIGSHLVELLVKKGHDVTVFDKYTFNGSLGWLENSIYKKNIKFILGDIRDYDLVFKSTKKKDCVLHLAALIGIPYSYLSPLAYIRTNIEGTYNILEASKSNNISRIIVTSTSETYGTAQTKKINEKHRLNAQSPYAASKIAADQLSLSYYRSFNLPVNIIRPFNTFGPRQSLRAIIPSIIYQIIKKKQFLVLGNLKPTRDFTYVNDTCLAFEKLINFKKSFGEVINIGSNNNISMQELANKIITLMNSNIKIKTSKNKIRNKKTEVNYLRCDNSYSFNKLRWKPIYNFEDSLKETIDWFIKNYKNFYGYDTFKK
jgi:NAD dependent epimerase/dehydratase